ncbi:hypothetical protein EDB89DRAFT_2217940 [Lactarius sanguifluus]|nr:hypothetical protein EDB89DRAFT_2217940 [Lactarius sanguifluus]
MEGPSPLSKDKEKSSPSKQPEFPFPARRAPSYFDHYPRQLSHPAPQTHYSHGRAARTLHSDLSSNSNFANVTINETSTEHLSDLSYFRISDSSSLTQIETPPQTPVDFSAAKLYFDPFSVVVSAPISGVETMDALVDGMNNFGTDDLFMGSGGISARSPRPKDRFHPLQQPPLPTPPPGVTLGGDDDARPRPRKPHSVRHPTSRPKATHSTSPTSVTISSSLSRSIDGSRPPSPQLSRSDSQKRVPPSISEIIRAYAPPQQQARSRPSTARDSIRGSSHGHQTLYEEVLESEPEPVSAVEEAELVSRTSVDSVAEEVRKTLRNQTTSPVVQAPALSPQPTRSQQSCMSEDTSVLGSPRLEGRRTTPSHNDADLAEETPPADLAPPPTQSQAIAEYLRSARLTTLLRLTRSPHASIDNPLIVSLSDLGSTSGYPLVVFLGLGGVRYVSGLYDEMAECLGIRLITIDRWGIGRTEVPKSKTTRGIPEWASAVEEILDLLHIDQCSVMAHSAGAPYALSFANKVPERIRGEIFLLAPWVGGVEGAGYKWLKYVPTGILKTAQAAEWKVQAWMLGKPPTVAYQGIGYDAKSAGIYCAPFDDAYCVKSTDRTSKPVPPLPLAADTRRPSHASSVFSDYDDLRDFEGRFDSRSTLGARSSGSHRSRTVSESKHRPHKSSRGFLTRLKGGTSHPQPHGRKLKALRSMGSLRGRSSTTQSNKAVVPPRVPPPLTIDADLGFDAFDWSTATSPGDTSPQDPSVSPLEPPNRRAAGRRSLSHSAAARPSPPSIASFPSHQCRASITATSAYQAALGNALIVAAHAESSRGTHGDLLQILNHDQQPWGFSYAAYPHTVRVWYGDRDEKIAENAVRWMERTMGPGRCADHGLMYRSSVVVEVLERVRDIWEDSS